jgi:hypothetical protein
MILYSSSIALIAYMNIIYNGKHVNIFGKERTVNKDVEIIIKFPARNVKKVLKNEFESVLLIKIYNTVQRISRDLNMQ